MKMTMKKRLQMKRIKKNKKEGCRIKGVIALNGPSDSF